MKVYQNPHILKELYWKKGLSQAEIAEKFGVAKSLISYFMKKFNIACRHKNKPRSDITKELLTTLYLEKKLSILKISKLLKTTPLTILKKMKKYGIKSRPRGTLPKYQKMPFSGNLEEKAYLLGLRCGDLWVGKIGKQIKIATATTHLAQLAMIKSTFEKYSKINVRLHLNKGKACWQIECLLDKSFEFLVKKPKNIPKNILDNDNYFYAFLAGYADCEAAWSIYNPKNTNYIFTKFQLATCDKNILLQIKNKLKKLGFTPCFGLLRKKGRKTNVAKYGKNLYFLYLNRQEEILKLAKILLKYSKHAEKMWRMKFIIENSGKKYEEVKNELLYFKKCVRETTLNKNPTLSLLSLQRAKKA